MDNREKERKHNRHRESKITVKRKNIICAPCASFPYNFSSYDVAMRPGVKLRNWPATYKNLADLLQKTHLTGHMRRWRKFASTNSMEWRLSSETESLSGGQIILNYIRKSLLLSLFTGPYPEPDEFI